MRTTTDAQLICALQNRDVVHEGLRKAFGSKFRNHMIDDNPAQRGAIFARLRDGVVDIVYTSSMEGDALRQRFRVFHITLEDIARGASKAVPASGAAGLEGFHHQLSGVVVNMFVSMPLSEDSTYYYKLSSVSEYKSLCEKHGVVLE